MKKGQVTIFVMIAVVLVVIIGLYFLLRNGDVSVNVNPEIEPVYNSVEECLESTATDSLKFTGQTGGYFVYPEITTEGGVAYYFYNGNKIVPTKERIEEELGYYIQIMLPYCVSNSEAVNEYNLSEGDVEVMTEILEGKVIFGIDWPLSIKRGDNVYQIRDFEDVSVPVNLYGIYDLANQTIDSQIEGGRDFCASCIYEWAEDLDLNVNIQRYGNDSALVIISDPNYQIEGYDFEFTFATETGGE